MTTEEFNNYLSTVNLTCYGHPIKSRGFFECNNGWLQLIHDLIEELLYEGWNGKVEQVKEKFGGLRFYSNSAPYSIIEKYNVLADTTCEICGEEGLLHKNNSNWYKTLCNEHAKQNDYEKIDSNDNE